MRNLSIVLASCGLGAQIRETELAPQVVADSLNANLRKLLKDDIQLPLTPNIPLGMKRLQYVAKFCEKLMNATYSSILRGEFPIIIGGDHSIAIGTWSGIINALNASDHFGLIWIDAHLDSHTYETSPSKAIHGMPIATLTGHGLKELVNIGVEGRKLAPEHVVIIGARSYEEEEHLLLKKLGVRIFYAEEVHKLGIEIVLHQAIEIASSNTKGFGISLDMDFFDPQYAPGVGSPEPGGFAPDNFYSALEKALSNNKLVAMEIAEYNPKRDINNKTLSIIINILNLLLNQS